MSLPTKLAIKLRERFDKEVERLETQIKEDDCSYFEFWLNAQAKLDGIMKDIALDIQENISNEEFIYIVLELGKVVNSAMEHMRKLWVLAGESEE
tara:strand:- start:295 stop:579 length:285 start_codon:yes stop_codon:yes gene_type:complete